MSPEIPDDRAVIDRIADGVAVLLVGPEGSVVKVDAGALPQGAVEGDIIEVIRDAITLGAIDHELTEARRAAARSRMARLREQRGGGRFERG